MGLREILDQLTARDGRVVLELDLARGLVEVRPRNPLAALQLLNATNVATLRDHLSQAAKDDRVAGLIIHAVECGQPMPVMEEVGDLIEEFGRHKPTVAWAESYGELGNSLWAYLLATAAHKVWVQPSGDVGIGGAELNIILARGMLEKVGIEPQFGKRWEYKTAADQFAAQDVSDANREMMTRLGQSLVEDAVATIARRRGMGPSFIRLTTVIGWPLPNKAGNHSVHGSKIGAEEITALKKELDFPDEPFAFDQSIVEHTRANAAERGRAARAAWDEKFATWQKANPSGNALLERVRDKKLPEDLTLPVFTDAKMSTRKASGEVLSALASQMPELWGGSADLAGSNNTTMKGEPSFLPAARQTDDWPGNQYGRTLHFGIREHAMGGIINGITLSGLTRAYGGTFMVFSDYMRPAVRLAAIMGIRSTFVWTHDSVGVGEDGPTHQPVEHLAALRAIPGLDIVRPADANETSVAWGEILRRNENPAGLVLSRQDLRNVERGEEFASADGVSNGGYVLREASGDVALILIATGSEVAVALDAQDKLEADGVSTRVVSMPCQEWFDAMDAEYKESVLPAAVTARVSVEAGIAMGWAKYVGTAGASVSIEHFGASASGEKCFEEFGFTGAHVAEVAQSVL